MLSEYLTKLFENEAIASSTLKSRVAFILSCAKVVPGKHNDLSFLNNTKAVSARIHDSENDGTIFNRYAYIVAAIDSLKESPLTKKSENFYRKQLGVYEKLKQAKQNDNRMTQKQIDNFDELDKLQMVLANKFYELFTRYGIKNQKINKADIERLALINKKGDNLYRFAQEYQELMIMSCYVFQPSLRDNYAHMKFASSITKTKDQSFNYLRFNRSWTECVIHMSVYKNVKSIGTNIQIKCTRAFVETMKEWYKFLSLTLGEAPQYVFLYDISILNKSIVWIDSKNGLTQRIKRASMNVFEKDLSINGFRHIWEIFFHNHPDYAKSTIGESEELHKMLLHSYDTAKRYVLIADHPKGPKE